MYPNRPERPDFMDLLGKLILALPDDALLGMPHDISMERLVSLYPEIWARLCNEAIMEQQATAETPVEDAKPQGHRIYKGKGT